MGTSRPLSPHLQVYRPQLTSVLSILHRMTGIFLLLGIMILSGWIISLSVGPSIFSSYQELLDTVFVKVCLVGLSFSMIYHILNGIRHLLWDVGWGLELKHVYVTGWIVISLSSLLTIALWIWLIIR